MPRSEIVQSYGSSNFSFDFFFFLRNFYTVLCFPDSSVGKESACNAGDPGSIPGSGRSTGEGIGYLLIFLGFPCGSAGKESACNVGDLGLISGLGMATHSSILVWRIPGTV